MVKWILLAIVGVLLLFPVESRSDDRRTRYGISLGFPQLISFTFEAGPTSWLRFQGTALPLIAINICTIRALLVSERQAHPYLFAGVGSLAILGSGDKDRAIAHGEFYLTGIGFRRNYKRDIIFMDLGVAGWIGGPGSAMITCGVGFLF